MFVGGQDLKQPLTAVFIKDLSAQRSRVNWTPPSPPGIAFCRDAFLPPGLAKLRKRRVELFPRFVGDDSAFAACRK